MSPIQVGVPPYHYRVDESFPTFPCGAVDGEAVGVACDSKDRVYVFLRGLKPVQVFDPSGKLLTTWGEGVLEQPHGIFIGPDDTVYCTDDLDHTIRAFTSEGRLRFTLGTPDKPSDTGSTSIHYRTIQRSAGPFNRPC